MHVRANAALPSRDRRLDVHEAFIVGMIEEAKDIRLNEMVRRPNDEKAVIIGCSAVDIWLRKRGWRFKKDRAPLEQERAGPMERREAWFDSQLDLDPARLVFIDETGISTKMARLLGRSPCGEQCRAGVPHGHRKTTTFNATVP